MQNKNSVKSGFYILLVFTLATGFVTAKKLFAFITLHFENKNKISAKVSIINNRPAPAASLLPRQASPPPPPPPPTIKPPALVLNGIVFSSDKGYALINNTIVIEGDKIEGLTVVRITKDRVELISEDLKSFNLP